MSNHSPSDKPNFKIHALIVAAGKGSRFGNTVPKQYLPLNDGKTVVQHTVSRLMSSPFIDNCHLVIAKNDEIAPTLDWNAPMKFITGGKERWNSVKAGVDAIAAFANQEDINTKNKIDQHFVLIHDAARPCVKTNDINKLIAFITQDHYLSKSSTTTHGAILATPVADTLKKASHDQQIKQTIERKDLWQAQTPQIFPLEILQTVLQAISEQNINITDEASGFEQLGYQIKIIEGSRSNLKLTYPEDLPLLQAVIDLQHSLPSDTDLES